jgi:parallel beta-helix repeat protein
MRRIIAPTLLLLAACGQDQPTEPVTQPAVRATDVAPGSSIQAAIDAAGTGDVIHIRPGLYREALRVDKPGIKIIGQSTTAGGVVLENPGDADNGIVVTTNGDGFALSDVTVRGFEENGVLLIGVDGFSLTRVTTERNGEYGLFPVRSSHGVIKDCSATGHTDTGIYVGQSQGIEVSNSLAFGNVIGIEIENSSDVRVSGNRTRGNTAGMLAVLLPGLNVKTSSNVVLTGNDVRDNNRPNAGAPGELESFVPAGSGILVVGADAVTVDHNTVTGNGFVGIGVASALVLGALAGLPPEAFGDIEPNPDGGRVISNTVRGNGGSPPPIPLPGADLFWDGSGTGTCWEKNDFGSSVPSPLPACR